MSIDPGTAYVQRTYLQQLELRVKELEALINTPEINDFVRGVELEAAHQRERWGSDHDAGKEPEDWFWLLGYLGGKALHAAKNGDVAKALHHCISTAAACANWHAALLGVSTAMRPGIDPATYGDQLAERDGRIAELERQASFDRARVAELESELGYGHAGECKSTLPMLLSSCGCYRVHHERFYTDEHLPREMPLTFDEALARRKLRSGSAAEVLAGSNEGEAS